jgi:hypothetical protein
MGKILSSAKSRATTGLYTPKEVHRSKPGPSGPRRLADQPTLWPLDPTSVRNGTKLAGTSWRPCGGIFPHQIEAVH